MSIIPKRLRSDGIREALAEVRFKSAAPPELTLAKLLAAAMSFSQGGKLERLPLADFPAPIRRADPSLMHQPLMQVKLANGRLIRLGEDVVSYHALQPYPGWETFKPEIDQAVSLAFDKSSAVELASLGIRYLNLVGPSQEISSIDDLNLEISAAGKTLKGPINLNYLVNAPAMTATIRLATPEFVQGPLVKDFSLMIDIEIRSLDNSAPQTKESVIAWIEGAHDFLKQQFFGLLKSEVLQKLT